MPLPRRRLGGGHRRDLACWPPDVALGCCKVPEKRCIDLRIRIRIGTLSFHLGSLTGFVLKALG
ncbi:MAG: hypothetical protein OXF68_03125 [Gammaproteobacteria bacterium]|nr:hypothetical protein [Gammaproteobacteria bacterium]